MLNLKKKFLEDTLISQQPKWGHVTGTCLIQKIYAPSSPYFKVNICPLPLPLNIFRLFVILSLTQLYRYNPEIFLFSTATFKYIYRAPLRRIGPEYPAKVAWWKFKSLKRIQPLPVCAGFFHMHSEFSRPAMCNNAIMIISSQM